MHLRGLCSLRPCISRPYCSLFKFNKTPPRVATKFRNSLIVPSNKFGGSSICILLFCIANYSHVFIYSILKLNTNVEIYSLDSFEIENIVLHDILINTLRIRNLFDKTSQISQGYLISKWFLIQKLSHQM